MPVNRLGELLITNGLVSEAQFAHALEMQHLCPNEPIGQLLCQLGYLNAEVLETFLDVNNKRQKLGEILVNQKLVDERVLNDALDLAQKEEIPLGRALIKLHILEEEQLAKAVAKQQDLPYMSLENLTLDDELAKIFNASYAKRQKIVPVRKEGGNLTLAMAYPLQRSELHYLESFSKSTILPVIATENDILLAQHKLYAMTRESIATESLHFEISEDSSKESPKSKYVHDVVTADVDYLVKKILTTGIKGGASDIHLESTEEGMKVRYRVDGLLRKLDLGYDGIFLNDNARQIVSKIKILCDMDISERRRPQDSSFKMKVAKGGVARTVDFRVSTVPASFGENVVIRILDRRSAQFSLESLGFYRPYVNELYRALEKPTGIFLVTGPTGSGKSSTLYAVLAKLNSPGVKTLTVEDPIEYTIDGVCQSEVNEVIGNSFARILRTFLRQDPDILMVGEIRDAETASISIRAAMTGHTVLSTLHTNDATSAIIRLQDMGIEPGLLATTIRGVLAQRLVRIVCTACRQLYEPESYLLDEFSLGQEGESEFYRGRGCQQCNYTGFVGRTPICELWLPTREELLFLNKRPDNITLRERVFMAGGRSTMVQDGLRKVRSGETTLDELIRVIPSELLEAERLF
jgi:type IV pilus assembly protein PilB